MRAQSSQETTAGRRHWRLNWQLVGWLIGRLLALAVLIGSFWLLYDAATSPDFRVSRVRIAGNQLAATADLEAAAAVLGKNVFWLRPGEVARRLEALPQVASAEVDILLPDLVEVRIRERVPFAVWQSGNTAFLVDESGMILASQAQAPSLIVVRDLSDRHLDAGDNVDADALKTAAVLNRMLPQHAGTVSPTFEYQPVTGIDVPDVFGWRVRFGSSQDLAWKVSALTAIRDQLAESEDQITFLDLRFKGKPYYR